MTTPDQSRLPCIVLHVYARSTHKATTHKENARTPEAALGEAVGLAEAINLDVVCQYSIGVARFTAATLIGSGQVENLRQRVEDFKAGLVVVDFPLAPVQQRNLEKELNCKVIDRTGLILEIFGDRARTHEGQLQVELAALSYQKSRLVRSWTHLERQRGGFGFMGGPGETQIELDRRMIGGRIIKIKNELEQVRRTRGLQRRARDRREEPVVALVGYTNAGKSTLFNALTDAGVLAKDMLFATLDPTMRQVTLAPHRRIMLADTVGFIADLPTHLVEAFRATLEEVQQADVILHVRDVASAESAAQYDDVMTILESLDIHADDPRIIEVLNKADLLAADERTTLEAATRHRRVHGERVVCLSAVTGAGVDDLRTLVADTGFASDVEQEIDLDYSEGAALSWLYEHARIIKRTDDTRISLQAVMSLTDWQRFQHMFKHHE